VVFYLLIAAVAATVLFATLYMRERKLNRRQQAIRALLDGADAVEAQLQACRERMQRLREMLSILPEEMSARADNALDADAKVQAALKDLLAHRLWIQQHAETASIEQFSAARDALTQSGLTLSALLRRLDEASGDLERAQTSAREAGRRPN
jgi:predicted nuclease with TOPRIM domain